MVPEAGLDFSRLDEPCGKVDFGVGAKIEGEAEGEITGEEIEIGPSAVVLARITANRLKIGG